MSLDFDLWYLGQDYASDFGQKHIQGVSSLEQSEASRVYSLMNYLALLEKKRNQNTAIKVRLD